MARRRNAIFHRFSRMRGLPPDEKMLMQRIGHMMDAALNNRQASNPYEPSKNNPDRVLYPPTGLTSYTGNRVLKLVWNAPKSDQHLRYEIVITNVETGESETKSSFTNELVYKNVNGEYRATVKSVGRDGSSSPIQSIDFSMQGSVMQIEGSKNTPVELGTWVKDSITVYDNYSVFCWASVVLDKFVAGTGNSQAVFRLWSMDGADRDFDITEATLHQTITMYPATESFADLDDNAHGGNIIRPIGARVGTFETSQSVMFSPIGIITGEESVTYTFFLEALGREVEQDEVNLSLVIWGGFDGLGDNVPQDPWEGGQSDYVFPHLNSLRLWRKGVLAPGPPPSFTPVVTDGSWYLAQQAKEYNIIDNAWTLAIWFRLETEHVQVMVADAEGGEFIASNNTIFHRASFNTNSNFHYNQIDVNLTCLIDSGAEDNRQLLNYVTVTVKDEDGDANHSVIAQFNVWTFGDHHTAGQPIGPGDDGHGHYVGESPPDDIPGRDPYWSPTDKDDGSYLWGNHEDVRSQPAGYNWIFMVICFEGGPDTIGTSLSPKLRVYSNNRHYDSNNPDDAMPQNSTQAMECLNQRVADGALNTFQFDPENLLEDCNQDLTNDYVYALGHSPISPFFTGGGTYDGDATKVPNATLTLHQVGMWNVALDNWDGMGFNPGSAEQRDSQPWYERPVADPIQTNEYHDDGRENARVGSSLTAIHYLFNQGYGADIDWKKNAVVRADGATEYIFAENLIHLWQFGAVCDEYSNTAETLRDTGNYMYGGDVNFLREWTGALTPGNTNRNLWSEDTNLADILSPVRMPFESPWTNIKDLSTFPPLEWESEDDPRPSWTDQVGLIQPAGHINGAGYPDAGTTASKKAYPGQGPLTASAGDGWINAGWMRPNVYEGVLAQDSPPWGDKSWGPIYRSISIQQAVADKS